MRYGAPCRSPARSSGPPAPLARVCVKGTVNAEMTNNETIRRAGSLVDGIFFFAFCVEGRFRAGGRLSLKGYGGKKPDTRIDFDACSRRRFTRNRNSSCQL